MVNELCLSGKAQAFFLTGELGSFFFSFYPTLSANTHVPLVQVFKGLRGLVGQTIPLQEDYYVSILREGWDPTALGAPGGSLGSPPPPKAPASTLDPASKRQLSMALEVMQECFHPIKDAYTQVDLIPFIVRSGK